MNGTKDFGIMYSTSKYFILEYTKSDSGGIMDDMKSTSGYIFHSGTSVV